MGSKRYAYLAEGVSRNGRVQQKTLAYLGPIVKIARGVPDEIRKKIDQRIGILEWDKIDMAIQKIPLEFEELEEIKRNLRPNILARRQDRSQDIGRGSRPRVEAELAALTLMARRGFNEMFQTLKDGTLVMK